MAEMWILKKFRNPNLKLTYFEPNFSPYFRKFLRNNFTDDVFFKCKLNVPPHRIIETRVLNP